jgi:hypothetical protein
MPNGSPNSSPLQQTLQQTAQQLSTTRPSTTIALSAITPSLVITQNKTTAGGKPGQTLLIATTKDGPMIVQPSNNPIQQQNTTNTNSNESSTHTTTGVSVPTTSTVVTIASRNIVSSANSSGQQNLMHHLMNSNSNPIQFQLVTNVSPSRPQTNANIGAQKQLAPRVVQLPPNVRLTPQVIRPGTSQGFAGQVRQHFTSFFLLDIVFYPFFHFLFISFDNCFHFKTFFHLNLFSKNKSLIFAYI